MSQPASSSSKPPRFAALQYRDFSLLWGAQLISIIGTQMQNIAVNWHVADVLRGQTYATTLFGQPVTLDAQALGLGAVGLVRFVPILFFALLGGALADTHDRRKIFLISQIAATVLAGVLCLVTLAKNDSLPVIYLIIAISSGAVALGNPSRQALIPNLVPRQHLTNALSLGTMSMNLGTVLGPALGGLIIKQASVAWVYGLNAISFVGVIFALAVMTYRAAPRTGASNISVRAIAEGFRFVRHSPMILSTMILDFLATFFSSAQTMLPIVASQILKLNADGYGLLATGQAVGSLLASGTLALRRNIRRQGLVLLASVCVYGLATAAFGMSTSFIVSYIAYALTGASDAVSTVIRNTVRQLMTPDEIRGRMTGVNMLFFMGGPQLGELEAGAVAAPFGVPFSIISGGIATVLITLLVAAKYPLLRHFDGVGEGDKHAARPEIKPA
ncbi:MAG TPA: MFS transporter [Thermoflexales bacterium]|nr:MFS transporter [Thermoflexales bacterium]HQW34133.1 MFS transporter [Thermoflexales bacterium]HQZ20757.1 MFS transporter [Thermoflexales bacterium]HQZ99023.1 MFS transporter [Thermoflexales bacterium]